MIKFAKSQVLEGLLNAGNIEGFLLAKTGPFVWCRSNDHQDGPEMAVEAVTGLVEIINSMRPGDQLFKLDLGFGGEMADEDSTLFLAGDEGELVKLLV